MRTLTVLLLILLLAFGLRALDLDQHNIWFDEGYSVWMARMPVPQLLETTAGDVHPPLYYLLLSTWQQIAGEGEAAGRYPSVLLGVIGVALAYRLGRAAGGDRAGLLAALLVAISRLNVTLAQEIRMHVLAAAFVTLGLWAAIRVWQSGGRNRWAGAAYVVGVTGALYTFYLTVTLPLIANLVFPLAWSRRGRSRRLLLTWIGLQIVSAALFMPWLLYILGRAHGWGTQEPFSLPAFVGFYLTTLVVGVPTDPERYAGWVAVVLIVLAVGVWAVWRSRITKEPHPPAPSPLRREGERSGIVFPLSMSMDRGIGGEVLALLLVGVLAPAVIVGLLTLPIHNLGRPIAPRYFLSLSVCFYVLLAWGLVALAQRRLLAGIGAGIVLAAALLGLSTFYDQILRDDYISIAQTLTAYRHPVDAAALHTNTSWPVFSAHYPGEWATLYASGEFDAAGADRVLRPIWEETDALWLVLTADAQTIDPNMEVRAWLESQAVASRTWDYGDNTLSVYVRTPERAATLYDLAPGTVPPESPELAAVTANALIGIDPPLRRYPIGDSLHFALYWQRAPTYPVYIGLRSTGEPRVLTFDPPPAADGITRQEIDIPLTPDFPTGEYQVSLVMSDGFAVRLADFTLISLAPDATVENPAITHPTAYRLGESIHLLGYDLSAAEVRPGDTLEVILYWQADTLIDERYKVLVYLLGGFNPNSGNPLWGQQDSEPLYWQLPTTVWPPGEIIRDRYVLPVDEHAPPGEYQLGVVMYGLVDGVRLPITDANGANAGDTVILTTITVR